MDPVTLFIPLTGLFKFSRFTGLALYIYAKPLNHINQFTSLNRLLNHIKGRLTTDCTKIIFRFKPLTKVIKPVNQFKPLKYLIFNGKRNFTPGPRIHDLC